VRWDEALFRDLESQFEDAARTQVDDVALDLAEAETSRARFTDRLRARQGQRVTLRLVDGSDVRGTVLDAAEEWLVVGRGLRRALVPVEAISSAWPLDGVAPEAGVAERVRIGHALRALARDGGIVEVRTVGGAHRGWIVRVGQDYVDMRLYCPALDEAQGDDVDGDWAPLMTVPLRHLLAVWSD
jgi:urease accessory protein UreE